MIPHQRLAVVCLMLVVAGCSQLKSDERIDEAANLVGDRTGYRPDWSSPWDDQPPVWDAHSLLTRDQAVVVGLRNNRELRAELATIGQADADLVQAGLMQNPVLSFMMMFPSGGGRSMLWGNGLPMQPIQDLWLIPVRKKVAQARLRQAMLRVADVATATAAEIKRSYARVQYAQRAIELIRENMDVVKQSTDIIRIRQTAGQASQVDLNLARIRHLRLESDLLQMQSEYRTGQHELLMLMGMADAASDWSVEPMSETSSLLEAPDDEHPLLMAAADQRLDLRAAEWQAQAAAASIKLTTRETLWFPGLMVGMSFQRMPAAPSNQQGVPGQFGNALVSSAWNRALGMPSSPMAPAPFQPKARDVEWMTGPMLQMQLPIFDQGQGKMGRALFEYRERLMAYQARCQDVIRAVRDARVMYHQAYAQVRFYRDSIMPEVERNLQLAQQAYVAGQESLTVFLQVQEDLIGTRLKMLGYFRDYCIQRAELERQVGGKLPVLPPATQPTATQPATK